MRNKYEIQKISIKTTNKFVIKIQRVENWKEKILNYKNVTNIEFKPPDHKQNL
jgi:hypothetical protein